MDWPTDGVRRNPRCARGHTRDFLLNLACAVGVAARADDFGFVGDAFAMSAAVFRPIAGGAATGGVCAFLGASHSPPLPDGPGFGRGLRWTVRCERAGKG